VIKFLCCFVTKSISLLRALALHTIVAWLKNHHLNAASFKEQLLSYRCKFNSELRCELPFIELVKGDLYRLVVCVSGST